VRARTQTQRWAVLACLATAVACSVSALCADQQVSISADPTDVIRFRVDSDYIGLAGTEVSLEVSRSEIVVNLDGWYESSAVCPSVDTDRGTLIVAVPEWASIDYSRIEFEYVDYKSHEWIAFDPAAGLSQEYELTPTADWSWILETVPHLSLLGALVVDLPAFNEARASERTCASVGPTHHAFYDRNSYDVVIFPWRTPIQCCYSCPNINGILSAIGHMRCRIPYSMDSSGSQGEDVIAYLEYTERVSKESWSSTMTSFVTRRCCELVAAIPDAPVDIPGFLSELPIRTLGLGWPLDIAFSPNGEHVAVAGSSLFLLDASTAGPICTLVPPNGSQPCSVEYSPHGRFLASGNRDGSVCVWNAGTGALEWAGYFTRQFTGFDNSVVALEWSGDGTMLAAGSYDGTVTVWRTSNWERVCRWTLATRGGVETLAFSPSSRQLACGSSGGSVEFRDPEDGTLTQSVDVGANYAESVTRIEYTESGEKLVIGLKDGRVSTLGSQTLDLSQVGAARDSAVVGISSAQAGSRFAVCYLDGFIAIHDSATNEIRASLDVSDLGIALGVAFSLDGSRLAVLHRGAVSVWDPSTGEELCSWESGAGSYVEKVAFNSEGSLLAVWTSPYHGTREGHAIDIFETDTWTLRSSIPVTDWVRCLVFSPIDGSLALSLADGMLRFFNPDTGETTHSPLALEDPLLPVSEIAFSPDGQLLAMVSGDHTLQIWDLSAGELLSSMEVSGEHGEIRCLMFGRHSLMLASGMQDGTVLVWDPSETVPVKELKMPGNPGAVLALAVSPDGELLAAGSDQGIDVWMLESGEFLTSRPTSFGPRVLSLVFSNDGSLLFVGSGFGGVQVWDALEWYCTRTLFKGEEYAQAYLSLSPDGKTLAVAQQHFVALYWVPEIRGP